MINIHRTPKIGINFGTGCKTIIMKKLFLVCLLQLGIILNIQAQNLQVIENVVKYNKADQKGFVASADVTSDMMQKAFDELLAKSGIKKSKKSKGFNLVSGAVIPAISTEKLDLYYSVSGKKNTSAGSVLISKGYDNFVNSGNDPDMANKITAWLKGLDIELQKLNHQNAIKAQEEVVKAQEKNLENVRKKTKDLEKELEKVQQQIKDNQKADAEQLGKLEVEKQKLETLRNRVF
jgi:hypothetical protein